MSMQSVALTISDAAINRHAADVAVGELRDHKSPLVLRFHKARNKATWYVVRYEQRTKKRYRLGYWPTLKTKDAQQLAPEVIKNIVKGEFVAADKFNTVGQLLRWYLDRCMAEKFKASSRKKSLASHINYHLLPKLGHLKISEVNKQVIDELFFLPVQADGLKASTIKNMFYTLKPAFKRAHNLGYIGHNPMSEVVFGQHVTKRIKPKECQLQITDREQLLSSIEQCTLVKRMFALFMLMFGTRIGETRRLLWSRVQLAERRIVIPAELTKTEESHVLPITDAAYSYLSQYEAACRKAHSVYLFEHHGHDLSAAQAQSWVRGISAGKWSAHDLRKFARSSWAELGIDYWVGERLVNHKPKGLDAVYIKAGAYEVKLAALEKYHNWLFLSRHSAATE